MHKILWAGVFLIAAGSVPATAQSQTGATTPTDNHQAMPAEHKPSVVSTSLKITYGEQSAEWTPSTLAALPHVTLAVYNSHAQTNQTYSGVPLIDLLKPLGVPGKPHGNDLRLYLVAQGADGYKAVYSVAEVNPDLHDGTVIVADTLDGKPLAENGAFLLVAAGEKRPARWVRNLAAIHVRSAD